MTEYTDFYEQVYSKDFVVSDISYGWIQWKGTSACVDVHCKCGHLGHVDADFFYFYECPSCHTKYAVGQNIKLIELTKEQVAEVEARNTFQSCDMD